MSKSRIIMLGTGDFALPTFLHLLETGHDVVTLITQPDRPQGRKQELIPSRIKEAALGKGVPVYQPENVNAPEASTWIKGLNPDFLVTAAYGQILSAEVLSIPRIAAINLHGSILPAYRGAAPVARAIERGETTHGVTVIVMNPRVDAGGMLKFAKTAIDPEETAGELEDRIAVLGAPLVAEVIGEFERGEAKILPQQKSKVTKAPKLKKEDGIIDWNRPNHEIHNLVRAMQPWPMASTHWIRRDQPSAPPARMIVHRSKVVDHAHSEPPGTVLIAGGDELVVATGAGRLAIVTLQLVGRKTLVVSEFLRGNPIRVGDRFGTAG